jgi:GntR family carbon starvation induced transcriptional regulator
MARTKAVKADGSGEASTLASQAYSRLRQDLIEARFAPGEKLRVRSLCKLYDIGLSPMREALNRASRDGLLRQTDLRGFSTAPLSEADLAELTKTRCWLNEIALRRSIEEGDGGWEESVVLAHYRLTRTPRHRPHLDEPRNPEWEKAHRAFHSSLICACGSRRLIDYCEQLFDNATRYRFLWSNPGANQERGGDEAHRRLMEATTARNADEAVRQLNEHFLRAAAVAVEQLRARAPAAESKIAKSRAREQSGKLV